MVWAYGLGWIMSNRIDHAQLSLTIVSPTNIGGPEKLTTKDYMYNYHTGEVYLLNNYEWFCFLERHNKLAEFESYMRWYVLMGGQCMIGQHRLLVNLN